MLRLVTTGWATDSTTGSTTDSTTLMASMVLLGVHPTSSASGWTIGHGPATSGHRSSDSSPGSWSNDPSLRPQLDRHRAAAAPASDQRAGRRQADRHRAAARRHPMSTPLVVLT